MATLLELLPQLPNLVLQVNRASGLSDEYASGVFGGFVPSFSRPSKPIVNLALKSQAVASAANVE